MPQWHHSHAAGPHDLLPTPLVQAQPPGHRPAGVALGLQPLSLGVQLLPAGGHLDQKALIPQEVVHLPVGIAASKGPKAAPLWRIAAGRHRLGDVLIPQPPCAAGEAKGSKESSPLFFYGSAYRDRAVTRRPIDSPVMKAGPNDECGTACSSGFRTDNLPQDPRAGWL